MHSSIFQVSSKPIAKYDWAIPEHFYDNSSDFADYIGDVFEGEERKEEIKHLAHVLSDLFVLDKDGKALVYKGGLDKFRQEWAAAIRKAAMQVSDDNVLESRSRYMVQMLCNETHLESSYRFKIEEWNGYAGPTDDLIEWIAYKKFKPGKKLYIGAVIDYHF